jgi:hypothetical protein
MDKEIVWSKIAENKFLFITSYLKSEWYISKKSGTTKRTRCMTIKRTL